MRNVHIFHGYELLVHTDCDLEFQALIFIGFRDNSSMAKHWVFLK